jgi:hypothetical protein
MKKNISKFVTFVTILVLLASCYYDNEEALYPISSASCDTLNVSFSGKISSILADKCLSCHSNSTAAAAGNNIKLQDYADVKLRAAAVAGTIKHAGTYSPMPKNGGKLNDCLISTFDIWVRNGSPQN